MLQTVLEALQYQSLSVTEWELIVVDNNSRPAVETLVDLSWHPDARVVREEHPGAQQARARGLRESRGELVINVDDDNVLAADYLEQALTIAREQPQLGAWSGRIQADYDVPPPEWFVLHSYHLAICEFDRPTWSSFIDDRSVPYGAGMCIRRTVVEDYLKRLETGIFARFGRCEGGFVAAEDQVIAYTAVAAGLAVGRFPQLGMRHRISAQRLNPDYMVKLVRGNAHGALMVQILHGNTNSRRSHWAWPLLKMLYASLFKSGMTRRLSVAEAWGDLDAIREQHRATKRPPVRTEEPVRVTDGDPAPTRAATPALGG